MKWDILEKTLEQAFCELTGFTSANWLHDKHMVLCPPFGLLSVKSFQSVGTDEVRYSESPGLPAGKELVRTICGMRQFTFTMQIETDSFAPSKAAWYYLETARTRLNTTRFASIISKCEMAVVNEGSVVNLDYTRDGRWVSRAALDVIFHIACELVDCPVTYIETVKVSSDIIGADGVAVGGSLDLNNRVLP